MKNKKSDIINWHKFSKKKSDGKIIKMIPYGSIRILVRIDGDQYEYCPMLKECVCGSLNIEYEYSSSSFWVICKKCGRSISEDDNLDITKFKPWLRLESRWNEGEMETK